MSHILKENKKQCQQPIKKIIVKKTIKKTTILLSLQDVLTNSRPVSQHLYKPQKKKRSVNDRKKNCCHCGNKIQRIQNERNGQWYVICSKTHEAISECTV
jgi:hypothetical protein